MELNSPTAANSAGFRDHLTIRQVLLRDLHPDPANARSHDDRNLAAIVASLKRFGQVEPLVVQEGTGLVIGGNGRLAAMKQLGWAECDVVELPVANLDATALGIALNRTAELASWDEPVLAQLLRDLQTEDELMGVGFEDTEIASLLEGLATEVDLDTIEDDEPPPRPETAITRPGDLWIMGGHRVLCGDSTAAESWSRLLPSQRADLVWTDPPYGVCYEGSAGTIENDDLDEAELETFLRSAFVNVNAHTKPGGCWYVAAPSGPLFGTFGKVLKELDVWRHTLVWVKDAFVLGRADYHYRHESLFYGWSPGAAHREPPDRSQDTVWEFPRPRRSPDHPTSKPVPLIARAIQMSSAHDELVVDAFTGSGSTLIACHETGRQFAGIELSPRFCDVIVGRWQGVAGQAAVLDGTNKTFEEVSQDRHG